MDFLARNDASFSPELWEQIDAAVVESARQLLCGRKFLPLYGPLGPGAETVNVDAPDKSEKFADGFAMFEGRRQLQIPQLHEDFILYWRDLASAQASGRPVDLATARYAAQTLARREDNMIFYGVSNLGIDGLLSVKGSSSQKRSDWSLGEGAFQDVVNAANTLVKAGRIGRHTLVVSMDLYAQLQRLQPGTGVLESERVAKIVEGRLFYSTALKEKTALLLCAQPQYMDLALGVDMRTAYTELADLNHHLRILETAIVRVKAPDAIVVLK